MGDTFRMRLLFRGLLEQSCTGKEIRASCESGGGCSRVLPSGHGRTIVHNWLIDVRACVQNGIVLGHIMVSMP